MNNNKGFISVCFFVTATWLLAFSVSAQAATINFTHVKNTSYDWAGVAVDPVTGKFYERPGYDGGATVTVYDDEAAFIAGSASGTVSLGGGGFYGTYFAVRNGKIYGRSNDNGTETARWDAATGTREQTRPSVPAMGGSNTVHTFTWGGYSGVNWLSDSSGLYVFGRNESDMDWQINSMDPADISVINSTTTYSPVGSTGLGFGFVINGTLFTGPFYHSDTVTNEVDLSTGVVTAVTHTLEGLGTNLYLCNFYYDYSTDTLYVVNTNTRAVYKADNASQQFPVTDTTPPPAIPSLNVLGLGVLAGLLVLMGFWARRDRRSAH